MPDFKLKSDFSPKGDQIKAIKELVEGFKKQKNKQVLLGVTGSGKSLDYDEQLILLNKTGFIEKVKIGEFVENNVKNPKRVNDTIYDNLSGYSVLSFNQKKYRIENKDILEISKHREK